MPKTAYEQEFTEIPLGELEQKDDQVENLRFKMNELYKNQKISVCWVNYETENKNGK